MLVRGELPPHAADPTAITRSATRPANPSFNTDLLQLSQSVFGPRKRTKSMALDRHAVSAFDAWNRCHRCAAACLARNPPCGNVPFEYVLVAC